MSGYPRLRVMIEVPVFPTESQARVEKALLNIFPDATVEVTGEGEVKRIFSKTEDLATLETLLRDQRIRDTARGLLLKGIDADCIGFHLNKQAAFAGRVNFTDGDSALGDLAVRISTEEPEAVVRLLTDTGEE
jgi:predicted RNA binding protein with dsRBD fold (UPF0201 family)